MSRNTDVRLTALCFNGHAFKKTLLITLSLLSQQFSFGQDTVSILTFARNMETCAVQFRQLAKSQGFSFIDYEIWEQIMTFDNFTNPDSIRLIRSYSVKTVLRCKGRLHDRAIYIPGRKNFNKIAYKHTMEMISDREGSEVDLKRDDFVKLENVPKEIAFKIRDKFIQEGAKESAGCFTYEYRQYYCTGEYTASFESSADHPNIYSIRLYKNY